MFLIIVKRLFLLLLELTSWVNILLLELTLVLGLSCWHIHKMVLSRLCWVLKHNNVWLGIKLLVLSDQLDIDGLGDRQIIWVLLHRLLEWHLCSSGDLMHILLALHIWWRHRKLLVTLCKLPRSHARSHWWLLHNILTWRNPTLWESFMVTFYSELMRIDFILQTGCWILILRQIVSSLMRLNQLVHIVCGENWILTLVLICLLILRSYHISGLALIHLLLA